MHVFDLIAFTPGPSAKAKKFLEDTAGSVGSYDGSWEVWPADEPGVKVDKQV